MKEAARRGPIAHGFHVTGGRAEALERWRERLEERITSRCVVDNFPELHGAELLPKCEWHRIVRRRRERLDAIRRVLAVLLERSDVLTGRIGTQRSGGGWTGLTQTWIGDAAGLSLTRTRRALSDLVRADYLRGPRRGPDGKMARGPSGRVHQPVLAYRDPKTGEHRWRAYAVVYVITPLLWRRLDMGPRLESVAPGR